MTDQLALGSTCVLLLALLGVVGWPVAADGGCDAGDGLALVRLPAPGRRRLHLRAGAFLAVAVAASFALTLVRRPSVIALYGQAVALLASAMTGQLAEAADVSHRVVPTLAVIGSGYLIGLAIVCRLSPRRRLLLAGHAALLLAVSVVAQALMVALSLWTGAVRPFGFDALMVQLVLGAAVNTRAIFTTFALPRPTVLQRTRPPYRWDTALAAAAVAAAVAIVATAFTLLAFVPPGASAHLLVPLYGAFVIFALAPAMLVPIAAAIERPPAPPGTPFPIDVITPAYNEAEGIERTLRSIDAAAAVYGGAVHVIVSNDGSTDRTVELAQAALRSFRHATGEVLTAPNGGKSAALNRALLLTESDVVVRMDGDCAMGPDALKYTAGWFSAPEVGAVGALMLPHPDGRSWFHRLRAIECLFQFGLLRRGQMAVDGMTTIPGTFVAFRRTPALAVGGFVEGMNGEDSELIMQLGRMGYRAVIDPRVRAFEDVPTTVAAFLEQRVRWSRGGLHIVARHLYLRSGFAGPRVWFWLTRRVLSWLSVMLGLLGPVYALVAAVVDPGVRTTVAGVAALYLVAAAMSLAISAALIVRHRQWRLLAWLPTWWAFAMLRRVAMLEALLSLPGRP